MKTVTRMKRRVFLCPLCLALIATSLMSLAQADIYNFDFSLLASELKSSKVNAIIVDGNVGFACNLYGVKSFDLSDPANPVALDVVATPGASYGGVFLSGFLFVADAGKGLTVVDASNPNALALLGSLDLGGSCRSLDVSGNYAYCAAEGAGLVIADISDPNDPAVVSSLPLSDLAYQVRYEGGYAFVAAGTAGLVIVDVQDPSTPTILSTLPIPVPDPTYGLEVNLAANIAAVANGFSGVTLVDVTDLGNPAIITTVGTIGPATHITFSDLYAIVSENVAGIEFIDFTGSIVGQYTTVDAVLTTTLDGSLAYTSEGMTGFEVVDIGDPLNPTQEAFYAESGGPRAGQKVDNIAYIADYSDGLTIMDLTDPAAPIIVSSVPTELWCYDVVVYGDYAYALDFHGELTVIDITDPSTPVVEYIYPGPTGLRSMDRCGDYLYLGTYYDGVQVVDITNPVLPTLVNELPIATECKGITCGPGYLYVSAYASGVMIYDLADQANPVYQGTYPTSGNARMTAVNGTVLYVAAEDEGVLVLDISDPTDPDLFSMIPLDAAAMGVTYFGGFLYVAHSTGGISAYDVTDPAAPLWYGSHDSPGSAYEVIGWDDNHILLCDTYSLEIYSQEVVGIISRPGLQPTAFSFEGNYPNPFNASTSLAFSTPVAGSVQVTVYDAMGRLVAVPFEGMLPSGEHRLNFNGNELASGTYITTITSPWGQQTRRMVLLK